MPIKMLLSCELHVRSFNSMILMRVVHECPIVKRSLNISSTPYVNVCPKGVHKVGVVLKVIKFPLSRTQPGDKQAKISCCKHQYLSRQRKHLPHSLEVWKRRHVVQLRHFWM